MYKHKPRQVHINIMFDAVGLGDLVGDLPALWFLYNNHPHVHLYVAIPDFFYEFAKNCLKGTEDRFNIAKWSQGHRGFKPDCHTVSFRNNHYTNLAQHMTEHAFHLICNTVPDNLNDYNYIQPDLSKVNIRDFQIPDKYVVVTTGYTAAVRQFAPQHVNNIVQYILDKGYTPVFLGKAETKSGSAHVIRGNFDTTINFNAGFSLIDQTNLFQATAICGKATAVVGLDNGILHLAACTDVPIVGGYTTVKPEHRLPYRKGIKGWNYLPVVPPTSLKCRFCQSNWLHNNDNVFTECRYVTPKEPDIACVKELDASLYIEQLDKIL